MRLADQSIVLTGAASGIGLALLERLAAHPVRLLAADLNAEALEAARRRLTAGPARLHPWACDLSSAAAVDRLFEEAIARLGRIDLFIANAGFAYYERIEKPDWERLEKIYRVNVFNTIYAVEKMQALYGRRPYKVVITASAMAQIAVPGYAIYASTKAALDRFVDSYRWQLDDPRKLMVVYPISTRTGFFRAAGEGVPLPWPSQSPQAVARAIEAGIRRDRMRVFPSTIYWLILCLDRFLPMHWLVQVIEQRRFERWLEKQK
ncbi:MAG: SDR family NAD(P)-dependent oxidoreductase [Anaerolineales bacterium]